MRFCTADNNTVRTAFNNMQEKIRVCLFGWRKASVTFSICHGAINCQVVLLNISCEVNKIIMIVCAVFFIYFICCAVHGIERIHADTTLETGCGLLTKQTLHFNFLNKIIRTLVNMRKTVDFLTCKA